MVSVTSASRYVTSESRNQSRHSMYIRGLITWTFMEFAEVFPIALEQTSHTANSGASFNITNESFNAICKKMKP